MSGRGNAINLWEVVQCDSYNLIELVNIKCTIFSQPSIMARQFIIAYKSCDIAKVAIFFSRHVFQKNCAAKSKLWLVSYNLCLYTQPWKVASLWKLDTMQG